MSLAFYIEDAIKNYLEENYETQLWEEVVRLYCETDIISKQMPGVISNAIRTTKKQT